MKKVMSLLLVMVVMLSVINVAYADVIWVEHLTESVELVMGVNNVVDATAIPDGEYIYIPVKMLSFPEKVGVQPCSGIKEIIFGVEYDPDCLTFDGVDSAMQSHGYEEPDKYEGELFGVPVWTFDDIESGKYYIGLDLGIDGSNATFTISSYEKNNTLCILKFKKNYGSNGMTGVSISEMKMTTAVQDDGCVHTYYPECFESVPCSVILSQVLKYDIAHAQGTGYTTNLVTGEKVKAEGDTVNFNVAPYEGYQIDSVTMNGNALTGNSGTYSFTMPAGAANVVVTTSKLKYALTKGIAENGIFTLTPTEGQAEWGTTVIVTAIPDVGYSVSAIKVNGNAIQGNTFEMPKEAAEVTVEFQKIPLPQCTIVATASATEINAGEIVEIKIAFKEATGNIDGGDVHLEYDSNAFEFVGGSLGLMLTYDAIVVIDEHQEGDSVNPGCIFAKFVDKSYGKPPVNCDFVTLKFKAKNGCSGEYAFAFNPDASKISSGSVLITEGLCFENTSVVVNDTFNPDADIRIKSITANNRAATIDGINATVALDTYSPYATVVVETVESGATVEINGVPGNVVTEDVYVGNNIFSIVVTAMDGVTTEEYTLIVINPAQINPPTYIPGGSVGGGGSARPEITISDIKTLANKEIEVTVDLENNTGFASLGIEVGYDSDVLTLVDVTANPEVGGIFTPAEFYTKNPFNMSWDNDSNIAYNGNLATLTFAVSEDASVGVYPITLDYYKGVNGNYVDGDNVNYDENFEAVDFAYIGGNVTVIKYIPGDVNGDEFVDNKDATTLLRYIAGWDITVPVEEALDVDGSGAVDSRDATTLLRYLAGWNVTLH